MRDASDLYDQLDTAILRARAVSQAHCAALEAAPDALSDGTHHHLAMVVESLLNDARKAAHALFETHAERVASKTVQTNAD